MKKQKRSWGMWRIPLCMAAGLMMGAVVSGASAQPIQAGDHYTADIPTPQGYKGVGDGGPASGWKYRLEHPGATYLALHFVDFDLGPMDYLVVSDPSGEQSYVLDGRGKMGAGTFWARHIRGDTVDLELIQVDPEGAAGFRIDEYVAGFLDIGDGSKAICGNDDKGNAVCYETSHPEAYQRGRAVARLLSNGSAFCTGWLVSADNHLITNEHCISSASVALNTDFDFGAEAPTCGTPNCSECFPGTVYSGATFIQDSYNLDYCLVQITSGDPAATFGYLEIDNRVATVGEQIYIVGHPGGRAKEMSIYSTDPSDTGGVARVYSITQPACQGSGYSDVGYYADTEGGSSGSPVLAMSSHKVIALHHCANCPNRGVPIHLIYPEIEPYLYPGPAGVVALDRGSYGCADTVEIEMRDGDLGGTVTQTVSMTTSGGDGEIVALQEIEANGAVFVGSIGTDGGSVVAGDGMLQVAHGQTLTVTYIDADDGAGGVNVSVTDTAGVDCRAPVIFSVQTTFVEPRAAAVQIAANEVVRGTVYYGMTCGEWTGSATGAGYANPASVDLTGLQDGTPYYYAVDAADEAGNTTSADNGGQCYSFTTPEVPDFFTELFDSNNDLDNLTLTFTPNGSNDFYAGCVESIAELPVDPAGGTPLTLSDDSYASVSLTGGAQVSLYGVSYSTFYPGSNGYITFTAGDNARNETLADHFDLPRISAVFDDFDPDDQGLVSWKQLADRVVVTWEDVPEYNTSNSNT
ncbi:MAG: trypsin-like peptidase domain-containing protein, partial [Phycisphaerae bacterium]|nr:trypsin-like peptidase domain-containing protein [Phycisphaerae bacterium]